MTAPLPKKQWAQVVDEWADENLPEDLLKEQTSPEWKDKFLAFDDHNRTYARSKKLQIRIPRRWPTEIRKMANELGLSVSELTRIMFAVAMSRHYGMPISEFYEEITEYRHDRAYQ